ncbi:MAG: N-acetylmuramoyl-L-alanine amidase, partial [Bacteroidaceae bacterium]|nr:N-acetylmuramoyl-L-alanine amidase [Bacteroidaceae bacterium]
MRRIDKIIVHCTATPEGREVSVKEIDRWHRERGFKCIGYHYVIGLDGKVSEGRPIEEIGAHCTGQNSHSVGVCYV